MCAVSNPGTGRFSQPGGDYLCDLFHETDHPDGPGRLRSDAFGAIESLCTLYGAIVGTECGRSVRPYVSFGYNTVPNKLTFGFCEIWPGFAFAFAGPNIPTPVSFPLADCLNFDFSWVKGSSSTFLSGHCSGPGSVTATTSAGTYRIRTA